LLAETLKPEGFLAATSDPRSSSHLRVTIVPPMLGLSVIDLREGEGNGCVSAVFISASIHYSGANETGRKEDALSARSRHLSRRSE
jgi:hypothetical protein